MSNLSIHDKCGVFCQPPSFGFVRQVPIAQGGRRYSGVLLADKKLAAALRDRFEHTRGAAAAKITV